jgi:hypothetical protein
MDNEHTARITIFVFTIRYKCCLWLTLLRVFHGYLTAPVVLLSPWHCSSLAPGQPCPDGQTWHSPGSSQRCTRPRSPGAMVHLTLWVFPGLVLMDRLEGKDWPYSHPGLANDVPVSVTGSYGLPDIMIVPRPCPDRQTRGERLANTFTWV